MAIGLSDVLSAMQNGVNAIRDLTKTINGVFPHSGGVTATPPSSTPATTTFLSSQSQGFMSVVTSSGGTYFVPLY
jgi:hypothetical protein